MDFLKRNLFFILCGVGAAAGIALMITGMQAMPKVAAAMSESKTVYEGLGSIKPANQKSIDAEKKRIQSLLEDRKQVLDKAAELEKYTPLVEGVFPDGPDSKRVEFRKVYIGEVHKLLDSLHWGVPPTAAEIETAKEKINEEKLSGQLPTEPEGKRNFASEPGPRAAITKAQTIFLYAVPPEDDKPPERPASLQLAPGLKDTGTVEAPAPEDTWRAQVWYWIQKDVVEAIRGLNEEAAEAVKKEGGQAWLGTLPVKEMISVRISEFVPPKGELYAPAAPGGNNAALPPGTAESVFTGTASCETYDVVQFTIKAVMDQRDIPLLVQKLCNNSPHTLVRTAYKYNPPSKTMADKIWGPEPAVNVILEFETIMMGDVFRKWMPKEVCDKNGIKCPEHKAGEKEGG
ncbi:MAG: hypothetical protein HY287_12030 [Planctomycetes bacterium]|nr:hypothetical protein [Planctomycetota bacterium]